MPEETGEQPTARSKKSTRGKSIATKKPARRRTKGAHSFSSVREQHKGIRQALTKLSKASESDERLNLLRDVCRQWISHADLQDEVLYPALEDVLDRTLVDEVRVEQDLCRVLLQDLVSRSPADEIFEAEIKVLGRLISRVIDLEENPATGVFAKAEKAGADLAPIEQQLSERASARADAEESTTGEFGPRLLRGGRSNGHVKESWNMAQRERDERGRFVDEDDYRGGRHHYSEERYGRHRDDERRGWYGDPRGHSEASRRGWDERRGGGHEDYDEPRHRRGGYDEDYGSGHRGWYGDPRGHAEASRRGWDERRSSGYESGRHEDEHERGRGHGGWYGDSEGHSEASHRGWDERRGDYDERRYGRSHEDDDYERRGGRHSGHGGWYGDSRGHSEASRRGWSERR